MARIIFAALALLAPAPAAPAGAMIPRIDQVRTELPPGAVGQIGSRRFWHEDWITILRFSPDGRTLFVGTQDRGALYAWDAGSGRLKWRIVFGEATDNQPRSGRSPRLGDIGFLGGHVAILLREGQNLHCVVHFDPDTGKEIDRVQLAGKVNGEKCQFSRDGARLVAYRDHNLAVYETATGRECFVTRFDHEIASAAFSSDRTSLVVSDDIGDLHMILAENGRALRDHHLIGTRQRVSFVGERQMLMLAPSATWEPIGFFNPDTGVSLHLPKPSGEGWHVWSSTSGPDGEQAFTGCRIYPDDGGRDDIIVVWDVMSGKEVRRFPCQTPFLISVAPGGKCLAAADAFCVQLFDLPTGKLLPQSSDPARAYESMRQRPDGNWACIGDDWVDVLDQHGTRLSRLMPAVRGGWWSELSLDGTRIVHSRAAAKREISPPLEAWDTVTRTRLASFGREAAGQVIPKSEQKTYGFKGLSPDGRTLYTYKMDSPSIEAWDITSGKLVACPPGIRLKSRRDAQSPDGRWRAMVSEAPVARGLTDANPEIRVVEIETGRSATTIRARTTAGIAGLAFSPDSRLVAVVPNHEVAIINHRQPESEDLVYLFEIPSGRELGRLQGPDGSVKKVVFTPDSRMIATAGLRRTARIWEVATLKERRAFPQGPLVRMLAFSRDGKLLAIDGQNAPGYFWDVYGSRTPKGPQPDAVDLDRAWSDLASRDAAVGFRALCTLVTSGSNSVRLLRDRLKLDRGPDQSMIRKWIADLESNDFVVREMATTQLKAVVEEIGPTLRKAQPTATSPEAKRRLQEILTHSKEPSQRYLRNLRSIEALEAIGTAEARQALGDLGKGPVDQLLTEEAIAALGRIQSATGSIKP